MESVLRQLKITYVAMISAAGFVIWLTEKLCFRQTSSEIRWPYVALVLLAVWAAVGPLTVRKRLLSQSNRLRHNRNDKDALKKWRAGQIVGFASGEAVVFYGITARFLGSTLLQALPFYVLGLLMLLLFYPRPSPTHV